MSFPRLRALAAALATLYFLTSVPLPARAQGSALRSRGTLAGVQSQFTYPQKIVAGPRGELYILDTEAANIYLVDGTGGGASRLCKPGSVGSPSDLAVGPGGELWVLDAYRSRVLRLDARCAVQSRFAVGRTPMRIHANSSGEVIILTGGGANLFDLYGADGKLIRSFGQRPSYGDPIADNELSDGNMVSDGAGGFYFSFNYPPLIRRYSRAGRLLGEFRPQSDIAIGPPNVKSQRHGNSLMVSAHYQVLVLDMAVDGRGRLHLLISGKDKVPALTEGSRRLMVVSGTGRTLGNFALKEDAFHRLAAANGALYLLRNRRAFRLEAYALP